MNHIKREGIVKYIVLIVAAFVLWSCGKDNPPGVTGRTVFVYLAADNTLSDYPVNGNAPCYELNITDMVSGMKNAKSIDGRIICLLDARGKNTQLIEITAEGPRILKDYAQNLNTGLASTFRSTFADAQQLAPALSYGLVMWSHGSGWLPVNFTKSVSAKARSIDKNHQAPFPLRPLPASGNVSRAFGQDSGTGADTWMTTDNMVEALAGLQFDFVLFDACFMASVELLYALRNTTPYFIASPTEIFALGFPYANIVSQLLGPSSSLEKNLKEICQIYFDFYINQPSYENQSATISLIRTAALEALASKMNSEKIDLSNADRRSVQRLDSGRFYPVYDFSDAYLQAQGAGGRISWETELNNVVIFERHTDHFLTLPINTCCGLSSYIPASSTPLTSLSYKATEWYKATN